MKREDARDVMVITQCLNEHDGKRTAIGAEGQAPHHSGHIGNTYDAHGPSAAEMRYRSRMEERWEYHDVSRA